MAAQTAAQLEAAAYCPSRGMFAISKADSETKERTRSGESEKERKERRIHAYHATVIFAAASMCVCQLCGFQAGLFQVIQSKVVSRE
ncbi:hypothetical protein BCR43DRAFT_498751 [Syncephalastrum racemosum]|uniref:Uncharacterized protein n=1 Tax=Syncephalastrum racemosum TaxID=13706 RepID=A0A1X2H2I9_SYNRA|nr:hypothetical protein BCR43DRAFT_498751 [Syncephalastrum racemosum]